jgi:hypothetical protein
MPARAGAWIAPLLFLVSVAALGFGAGVAVMMFRLFPYPWIQEAKLAFDALGLLEDETLMPALNRVDAAAPAAPRIAALSPRAGTEALLVTGGPGQHMDLCPRFGCLAWIVDRQGRVLHTWEVDWAALAGDMAGFSGNAGPQSLYPVGLALLSGGELAVTLHGRNIFPYQVGIARISAAGEVLWVTRDHAHHWIDADAAGNIYAPSMRPVSPPPPRFDGTLVELRCRAGTVYAEGVTVYGPDGTVLRSFDILRSLAEAGWPGLLYGLRDGCDPAHLNAVAVAGPAIAARLPGIAAGDLLVSVREPSAIAILDGETGAVKRLTAGRTAAQHGPQFLPDGTVVAFDNQGGDPATGGSRILRLDMVTGAVETVFPRRADDPALPFVSVDGGHVEVSPDGTRIMISSKDQARSLEVEVATGEVLWTMDKCFDIGPWLALAGAEAEAERACFNDYGAAYLTAADLAFLGD